MTAADGQLGAAAPDAAAVQAAVRRAGSSFFWGMRVLPPVRREAVYAVYAFCRAVDDVADGPEPEADKIARLCDWRRAVDRLYQDDPQDPITRVLARHRDAFDLPRAEFHAIVDGMERDARGGLVAPTRDALIGYCREVAGAVGVLSMQIFAHGDPHATPELKRDIAVTLGEALQFTNILRDLGADRDEGRLYLPAELLAEAGIAARDPAGVLADPRRADACSKLAAQARQRFQHVRGLLDRVDPRTARPCRLMLEMYARLLERLQTEGFPTDRRVRLPQAQKAWVVLRYGLLPVRG